MQLRWALVLSSVLAAFVAAASDLEAASQVLNSAYRECAPTWSHTCLQKKVLVFVDRLDGVRSIPLLDGWTVETTASETARSSTPITENELASLSEGRAANSAALDDVLADMLDNRLSDFFQHRVLRMSVPQQVAAVFSARGIAHQLPSVDFSLGDANDNGEARLKKKKKLKLKALLLGLVMVGGIKLIKLMPIFLALIKLKAIKAIILALISLAISVGGSAGSLIQRKLALFQSSPMKHVKTVEVWLAPMKGGHGGGGHGGGHGGGDSYGAPAGGGGGGHDSYSAPSHGGGGGGGSGGGYDSYSNSYSGGGGGGGGGGGDSYSVGGGSYGSGGGGGGGHGGGGWQSKSESGADIAYRAHAK